jgi:hypothetical protein
MNNIKFVNFNQINPEDFLPILNEPALREHLIDHDFFYSVSIKVWVDGKVQTNSMPGCRVRAVFVGEVLAGWCGIQADDNGFELAIVISQEFWGAGISIFSSLICWAKELGHKEILFHLLETRPEYKFLKRKATKIQKTELLGRTFRTYFISVDKWFLD